LEIFRALSFTNQPSIAGEKLKSKSKLWTSTNSIATNESGFSALPGGFRGIIDGSFMSIRSSAFFWSATESGNYHAWNRDLDSDNGNVDGSYDGGGKSVGYSVRCLRD
jgi:uncharacterized protein (TIGR02145 family)